MLKVGKIKKYNEERGFGFIEVEDVQQELFFHIKDFPKGKAPQIGERLTFNTQQYDNKLKAVNITRLDVENNHRTSNRKKAHSSSSSSKFFSTTFALLMIGVIGYFVYGYITDTLNRNELASQPVTTETLTIANQQISVQNSSFRCDGRIHCSQMTSKAEAQWFLNNCPGTKMDGDGDGDACERQFGSRY